MEETPLSPRLHSFTPRRVAHAFKTAIPLARIFTFAAALTLIATTATAHAADWRADAVKAGLTPPQIDQLARDKLIIGPETHPQIFTPYIQAGREKIRFITSDAALAAYHALFEDSFRELELRRAYVLRTHLQTLFKQTRGHGPNQSPAQEFIQQLLGPALVVLGAPLTDFDEKLRPEIEHQVALIRAATDVALPEWLGPPTADLVALDYRRCKPVSFYAGQPALENYFRALRWLQLVPLRADRDNELIAWALMANLANDPKMPEFAAFFSSLSVFVGPQTDRGLSISDELLRQYAHSLASAAIEYPEGQIKALKSMRACLLPDLDSPPNSINNDFRFKGDHSTIDARLAQIRFRIAPTFALPDAEIISQSLHAHIRPDGLMIAAFLGSEFAAKHMPKVPDGTWASWKKSARALTLSRDGAPRSLYADYIDTLRALNAPPVENAPAFMRSPAWQAKTLQTQLASWTQARHTYTLQAKFSVTYFSYVAYSRPPPGFVEPNLPFWREYDRLVERTARLLKDSGVFTSSPLTESTRQREAADALEKLGLHHKDATLASLKTIPDDLVLGRSVILIRSLGNDALLHRTTYPSDEAMRADFQQGIDFLNTTALKIERAELTSVELPNDGAIPLSDRWTALATLARQLETIVAKQLDETELNDADRFVLIQFGQKIAHTMGYFSDAYKLPRDDAPRWAEVAHDTDADQSLGIGTGRAKTIHVLYPWHGEELLCAGAVLPYFEEWAPTRRLTDDEWKQKLDSPAAPPPPSWIQPVLAP
jgi:hypothetical protein